MRYGLELSAASICDPRTLAELVHLAEKAGWDGVFLEDYIVHWSGKETYDPWVALAAIAMRTEQIRLGTTVTPLSRRRPWKVAREAVTLDHLSNGRLTLGVGLGDVGDPVKEQIELYKDFVRPLYATRDIAHNFDHIERIIRRIDRLSEGISPPPRRDRLNFLACFHGLGARLRDDESFHEQTIAFLKSLGWTEVEIPQLFQSLERHLESPETVEEEIVHDANKVEILGAFGVAKAFTMGAILGQSYEETADYFEHEALGKTVFRTPAGKQLAEEGRAYALEFLKRFRRELTYRDGGHSQEKNQSFVID